MEYQNMTTEEMITSLENVWANMTSKISYGDYSKMLVLLYNMYTYINIDLNVDFPEPDTIHINEGTFSF